MCALFFHRLSFCRGTPSRRAHLPRRESWLQSVPPEPRVAGYMISRFLIRCSLLALALSTWSCALDEEAADFAFLNDEPESIDPGRVTGQPGGRIALSLFEGLCYRHPQTLAPMPGIAESWEQSNDGIRGIYESFVDIFGPFPVTYRERATKFESGDDSIHVVIENNIVVVVRGCHQRFSHR